MDKRKLRLILLVVVGIIVLVIGIGAANIYTNSSFRDPRNEVSQYFYSKNYDQLNASEKATIDSLCPTSSIDLKNAQFRQWLVKWVVIPFCVFLILTGAIVASLVIWNKTRPPSGPS